MTLVVFYSEKVPVTREIINTLRKKGREVEAIQIDRRENKGYIKQYQITLVPTILTPDGRKIEGANCSKFVNAMQNQISGNGSSMDSYSTTKDNFRIDTPQGDDLARMTSFVIPNGGLMGNKLTNLQDNPVIMDKSSGGLDERLANLNKERESF